MIQDRNYLYTVEYFVMEDNGGYGLDWRDLLKSTPSGMDMSLGRTRDGRIAPPTRVHPSVNTTPKSGPTPRAWGKGKRSLPREGLRPCPASFQSVKLGIEYLLKI
jgi:hypothetical protein